MQRVTLSLEEGHAALLDAAADEWDVSRSEAARRVFSAYEERMNSSYELPSEEADFSHDAHTEFTRRLDELAERVDDLEAGVESDRSESAQPGAQRDESTADREAGADDSRSDAHSEPADVARAVEAVATGWSDDPDRLEARKAAAVAVLTAALEGHGAIGRSEAVERFFEDYPVAGQNERTWWRKNARPVLREYGSYSQGQQGYVVDELPTG